MKLKEVQEIAKDMIDVDRGRDALFQKSDEMFRSQWSVPAPLDKMTHIRKVVSTDPHDAIRSATRVLSAIDPVIKFQPLVETLEAKGRANDIERALKWHLMMASRRRRASIVQDIVSSSLRYDEVCAQVILLDDQIKHMGGMGVDTRRLTAAKRYGPFAIVLHNPKNVHTRYSALMPEAVLLATVQPIREVIDMWGNNASKVRAAMENDDATYVSIFDYQDLDTRAVWCTTQSDPGLVSPVIDKAITILEPQDHGLPFLPWACRVGGTTLESDAEHQRIPMLYSLKQSGQWDTQNVMLTLLMSEVIAYAASPRLWIQGPNPDSVEVDYGDVNKPIETNAQTRVEQLPPPPMDAALFTMAKDIGQSIGKSTVSAILQGSDVPAGTAYATLNLATLTAIGALKPYKELAELGIGDVLTQMLLWINHSGQSVSSYTPEGIYEIRPEDVDPQNIYISVELKPDKPIDRQQAINSAATAIQQIGLSRESALEDIGVPDPQRELRRSLFERLMENEFQKYIRHEQMQEQLAMQAKQMEMQAQLQQGQQAQQAEIQQAQMMQEADMKSQMAQAGTPPGVQGAGGQGFNPAAGGQPPTNVQPGATREGQTGRSLSGEEALR